MPGSMVSPMAVLGVFAVSAVTNYRFNFRTATHNLLCCKLIGMRKTFSFLLTVFFLYTAKAQYDEKDFVSYTVKEGLSENYITSLVQDGSGYIWIGTDVGLNRFDGHSFKNFYQGTSTMPLLSSSIRKLKSFGSQQLGIIGHGGFQLFNTKDLSIKNYIIADTTAFSKYRNEAWDAVALKNGFYAVTTSSGFYVFDAAGKVDFSYDAYQLKEIGQKRILYGRDIFPLGENEYLVYINGDGLAYYNAEKKSFVKFQKMKKNGRCSILMH